MARPSFWGGSSLQGVGLGGPCIPAFEMKETGTDGKAEMSPLLTCLLVFLVGCSGCQHHACRCMGRVFICQESKVVQVPRDIPANATELWVRRGNGCEQQPCCWVSKKTQTPAWQAKGRVCRESLGRLTPAVWKAQPFLRHLLNYILKLLSITLIVLVLRSLLRKDMVRHNAKCRLNFKQASLVLWQ